MKVLQGQKFVVKDSRKGTFEGMAIRDFDTHDEWYPVSLNQEELHGLSTSWFRGESVPCRKGISNIILSV